MQVGKMISEAKLLQEQRSNLLKDDKILSDNNINTGRQPEVDLIKFFAIPFMVCIHIYEQIGGYDFANEIPDTFFRNMIEFVGGPLAAPVFMFSMGIGMIYTKRNSPSDHIKRGCKLLLAGYALNFFRQTLPQLLGITLGIDSGIDIVGGMLCVDILPFAGMAFITVGCMKKIKLSSMRICVIAFIIQAAGIWSTRFNMRPGVIQNILGVLVPTGKWTSFPLTLWLVYPSLGMLFGEFLMKCKDKNMAYRKLMIFSIAFLGTFTVGLLYPGYDIRNIYALCGDLYYHNNIISTLWITPIIILALGICWFMSAKVEKAKINGFIRYCSINLNTIYIIQWLIIAYSVAIRILLGAEKTRSPLMIISCGIIVTALSIVISIPVVMIKQRKAENKVCIDNKGAANI